MLIYPEVLATETAAREPYKILTTPEGLEHMPLEWTPPHSPQDAYKRQRDMERANDDLADRRRLFGLQTITPEFLYNVLRVNLLAGATYESLEAKANKHGYTVPLFAKQIKQAA